VRIVKLNGGLGNQMFQYAFALALDGIHGDVRLDLGWMGKYRAHNGYELDRLFAVRIPVCTDQERERIGDVSDSLLGKVRRRLRMTKRSHYASATFGFDPEALKCQGDRYFSGYWQSHRYYEGREDSIRNAFAFTAPMKPKDADFLESLSGQPTVGIHVRRGDYLRDPMVDGVCGQAYYERVVAVALEGLRDPTLVFFSDDLDWCRDRLSTLGDSVYVDWNRGVESHADMRLMSLCDRLVIANSSFSWWGAYLGKPDRRVFAPSRWFADGFRDNEDIAPPGWIRVPIGE
jgi:hypothetical protein